MTPKICFLKKVLILFLFSLITTVAKSQKKSMPKVMPDTPKLVIGIVIDQMRYDYIFRYWNKFGEGGFKKLLQKGYLLKNANYNYVPTYTGPGHACIYTGTTPAVNGIISNDWYRKAYGDSMYVVQDDSVSTVGGIGPAGKMSPKNMLTNTVTDELRYSTGYKNKVIGISIKDRGAILPGGHSANGAYWYDGKTGNWISSTYYMKALPQWAQDFNQLKLSDKYLQKPWTTLLPIETYTESTVDNTPYEEPYYKEAAPIFPHDFPTLKQDNYELIKRSPWGNSLTKDFAISAIKNENLGQSNHPDFIAISFSSTDYVGHQFGCDAIETEDTYLRLDKDLEELFSYLEANIGKNNILVFLTADHAAIPNPKYLNDHGVPAGLFDLNTLIDALKQFLQKNFGDSNLIACVNDDQLYFNHNLLKKNKIDLSVISESVIEFLLQYEGIARVISAETFSKTEFNNPPLSLLQKGFNQKLSGDIIWLLSPGLIEYRSTGTTHGSAYTYDTHVPLFFYGWKIPQGSSSEQVYITDIAPTLSNWLNIEYPNGCTGKVIPFILK